MKAGKRGEIAAAPNEAKENNLIRLERTLNLESVAASNINRETQTDMLLTTHYSGRIDLICETHSTLKPAADQNWTSSSIPTENNETMKEAKEKL